MCPPQPWIASEREHAPFHVRLLHAVRCVRPRAKVARVQASKQRAEDARRKEVDDTAQRKVREAEQAARAIAVKKAEELARKEALRDQRFSSLKHVS